jgi:UDP-N-acetylglucosamine acyltransferase
MTGLNVIGLRRAGFSREDRAAIKSAFDLLFRSGMNLSQALAAVAEREWPVQCHRMIDFVKTPSKKGICPVRGVAEAED